jgi:hypothetical protein
MPSTAALVRRLTRLAWQSTPAAASEKGHILDALQTRRASSARDLRALHDVLCLWRAYPDNREVLARVERLLDRFGARRDVRHHRAALENSGIAGTDLVYPFGAPTAQWLAATAPAALSIAWDRVDDSARLGRHLLLLARAAEVPGFDEAPIADVRRWLEHLRGGQSDAAFIVRTSATLDAAPLVRDRLFEELDLPIRVAAGSGSPDRTTARWTGAPVVFCDRPFRSNRPDLHVEATRPVGIRPVARRQAEELIGLAHEAMVTRERDLDAFANADARDVRLVEWGEGLQMALLGVQPDRRFLLESVYAGLLLRSGVPIGYALVSALFGSSELAFNVFETFRGGETAWIYARLVATAHQLFGADTLAIYPYQLGHENDEGLQSGAWWFYYKLGFRPRERSLDPIIARELARLGRRHTYRTPVSTLQRLVRYPLFLSLGAERDDVMGVLRMDGIGLAVTDYLVKRFGADREGGERACAREGAARLGVQGWRRWGRGERVVWRRCQASMAGPRQTGFGSRRRFAQRVARASLTRCRCSPSTDDSVARCYDWRHGPDRPKGSGSGDWGSRVARWLIPSP